MPTHNFVGQKIERRGGTVQSTKYDVATDSIPVSISSEVPVEEWGAMVSLSHAEGAIDFSIAKPRGLVCTYDHDRQVIVGRIRDVAVVDNRLTGRLFFSKNARAQEIRQDLIDEVITDTSIRADVKEVSVVPGHGGAMDMVTVTKWRPFEACVTPIPKDHSVGVNRNFGQENTMSGNTTLPDGGTTTITPPTIGQEAKKTIERAATTADRERIKGLRALFDSPICRSVTLPEGMLDQAIDGDWTIERARAELFSAIAGQAAPTVDRAKHTDSSLGIGVSAGQQEQDKLGAAIQEALIVRAGLTDDKEMIHRANASGLRGMRLLRIGQQFLRSQNIDASRMPDMDLARLMLRRSDSGMTVRRSGGGGPISHSDLGQIFANVAHKALKKGWDESGATWQQWCNVGELTNFQTATLTNIGAMGDFEDMSPGGGEFSFGNVGTAYETAQLETAGRAFGFSRRALVDDNLQALTRVPMGIGRAGSRKVNAKVYAVLTGNQVMTETGLGLFHADHGNLVAPGSGAAPSVATLDAANAKMGKQKPPLGRGETFAGGLNLTGRYLIVPLALKATGQALASNQYDPYATNPFTNNPYNGNIEVVADALLDADDPLQWYLVAGKNAGVDTVTVFFLNGQQEPTVEETDPGRFDGMLFNGYIDVVARALDYRGMVKNYGS